MGENTQVTMEKLVALCKRRGFVYQGSEIYGGLAGTWDYGPLGVELKKNIILSWWKQFVSSRNDMYGLDAAVLMNSKVWEASGHTGAGFSDLMVECRKCGKRSRFDHLEVLSNDEIKAELEKRGTISVPDVIKSQEAELREKWRKCECGAIINEKPQEFNLMFETKVGARQDITSYLRPETAQGIFVNFKNVVDSLHPKIPFGIAQIGKAFRNEIAPREFLFRTREFEQLEIEYFVRESEWEKHFEKWRTEILEWIDALGVSRKRITEHEISSDELAHYSKRTIDFEYDYPSKGFDELLGLAYRTDFDLANHTKHSGTDLTYTDEDGNKFIPHAIEPSFGLERLFLAILAESYAEDEMGGERRTVLKLPVALAPIRVAVFPLLKNKPELMKKARELYKKVKDAIPQSTFDDNGNIGKRYRRQDEIGTPHCITIDFQTLEDETVTIRDRDSGKQRRVKHDRLLKELIV